MSEAARDAAPDVAPRLEALPPSNEPLRVAVRRIRWFTAAFHRYVETFGADIGCDFEIDDEKLAAIFVRWLRRVNAEKPADKSARRAFFEFAASLMMSELASDMPLRAKGPPRRAEPDSAAAFWPAGYVCAMFCLAVHSAAMREEYRVEVRMAPAIRDLGHWWSFRENAREDAASAAGFLQFFLGGEPNWAMPTVFRARLAQDLRRLAPGRTSGD